MAFPPILHQDGKWRCHWVGSDPLYCDYHDQEWGVPEYQSRALFEKLILDGFQAGLSWITILRKRPAFRVAFDQFHPEKMALYTPQKVEDLLKDAHIIRHRGKIEGAIRSAQAFLEIESREGFSAYLWKFVEGIPLRHHYHEGSDIPTQTDLSRRLSQELKRAGFSFVGPTIVYAFMQAVGMVQDHVVQCHCYGRETC